MQPLDQARHTLELHLQELDAGVTDARRDEISRLANEVLTNLDQMPGSAIGANVHLVNELRSTAEQVLERIAHASDSDSMEEERDSIASSWMGNEAHYMGALGGLGGKESRTDSMEEEPDKMDEEGDYMEEEID